MLKLYAFQTRSRAERIIWALNEAGLDFELTRLNYARAEHRSVEFLALNPDGTVPVLVHDGQVLTESTALLPYIDSIGHCSIIPGDRLARYLYDQRVAFLVSEFEPYLWVTDKIRFLGNPDQWPEGTLHASLSAVRRALQRVESWVAESSFVAGSRFTAADILSYHLVTWAASYGLDCSQRMSTYLAELEARSGMPEQMKAPGSPADSSAG